MTQTEKKDFALKWLGNTKIDADVTNHTLGMPVSTVTLDLLLEASKKLIKINKQEAEPDNGCCCRRCQR